MESTLPTGGCNYRDLSQPIANNCGCQRFWLRKARKGRRRNRPPSRVGRIGEDRRLLIENGTISSTHEGTEEDEEDEEEDEEELGDCHCGHHACYHSIDHSPPTALAQSASRRYSLQISDTETSIRLDRSGTNLAASGISVTSGTTTERDPCSSEQSPSIVAARRIKSHYQPSQLGSEHGSKSSSQNPGAPVIMDAISTMQSEIRGMRNQLEAVTSSNKSLAASMTASTATVTPPTELAELRKDFGGVKKDLEVILEFNRELKNQAKSHNERLETVETFGSALEEIREKVELTEDRALEVEEKVLSFENRLDDRLAPLEAFFRSRSEKRKHSREGNDGTRRKRRRRGREAPGDGSSPQEVKMTTSTSLATSGSVSTSFSGTPSSNDANNEGSTAHLLGVMEDYESRFLQLEDIAPPTPSRPWVIEVVLIPPAPLKGIWVDPYAQSDAGTQYESSNPQSTGTNSNLPYSRRASREPETIGPVPKSFSIRSRLYRRLHSRGFVRKLAVYSGTARDVAAAIEANFAKTIDWCRSFEDPPASETSQQPASTKPIISSSTWQPLRKVHKQTVLEFLRPGEMIDGIWTVEFLRGTCLMKGSRKVLYVTLSSPPASSSSITWADIKSLPKFEEEEISQSPDDECWSYRHFLDEPPININSPGSSFGPFQLEEEVPPSPPHSSIPSCRNRNTNVPKRKGSTTPPGQCLKRSHTPGNVTPVSSTPAAGRSNSYPPTTTSVSARGSVRRTSSGLSEWELSPATLGWFTQHPTDAVSQGTAIGEGDGTDEEELDGRYESD